MAYDISFRDKEGEGSALYARIKRKADGYWWDEVADAWIAAVTSDCDVSLTEGVVGDVGKYSGTASFNPAPGGVYVIYIYYWNGSVGTLLFLTEDTYQLPYDKSALDIVKDVQRELRLPEASDFVNSHAKLILSFANKVLRVLMPEQAVWDELKIKGSFMTVASKSVYSICPINTKEIDVLSHFQIGTDAPLVHLGDDAFRSHKRSNTSEAQPLVVRIYGRTGPNLLVELSSVPDAAYQVDYEGVVRTERLVATGDIPMLDPDTVTIGALWLAKVEQGVESEAEQSMFLAKISTLAGTQGESNLGDVEAV